MNNNYPKRVSVNPENPQLRWISRAAEILREGGVLVYPTDSRYGLGCDIFHKKAMERINQIKKRDKHHPMSIIFPDLKNMSKYVHIDTANYKILRRCLPGPFTFILEATREIPKLMLTNRRTVGIRIPDQPIIRALVEELDNPVINSSVGDNSDLWGNDPEMIEEKIGHAVDMILDGGIILSAPSTVVDLTGSVPELIREGKGDPGLVY